MAHGDHKNCVLAACVFSSKFPMLMQIVDSENNYQEGRFSCFSSANLMLQKV